MTPGP